MTVMSEVLVDDSAIPDSFDLDWFNTGAPAIVEARELHAWGTWHNAGPYVMRLTPDLGGQGVSAVRWNIALPEDGYIDFWMAVAISANPAAPSGWQVDGGAHHSGNDSIPNDWKHVYVRIGAGEAWDAVFFPDTHDPSAATMWLSKFRAVVGEDPPNDATELWLSGTPADPNYVELFRILDADPSTGPFQDVALNMNTGAEPATVALAQGLSPQPQAGTANPGAWTAVMASEDLSAPGQSMTLSIPSGLGGKATHLFFTEARTGDSIAPAGFSMNGSDYDTFVGPIGWREQSYPLDSGMDNTLTWRSDPGGLGTYYVSKIVAGYAAEPASIPDVSPGSVTDQTGGGSGSGVPYKRDDWVRHLGGLYLCMRDGATTEPGPGDSADWAELVARP